MGKSPRPLHFHQNSPEREKNQPRKFCRRQSTLQEENVVRLPVQGEIVRSADPGGAGGASEGKLPHLPYGRGRAMRRAGQSDIPVSEGPAEEEAAQDLGADVLCNREERGLLLLLQKVGAEKRAESGDAGHGLQGLEEAQALGEGFGGAGADADGEEGCGGRGRIHQACVAV